MTLENLLCEYTQSVTPSSSKTITYYFKDFIRFVNNKQIEDTTIDDIQKYINFKRAQNLKETTIYSNYRMLCTVFNYAVSHGKLEKSPCKGVTVKRVVHSKKRNIDYSKKYIKKLKKIFKHTKIYYIVIVALHTGMRRIEILRLKKCDINFRHRKIFVHSAKNCKNRIIYIDLKLTIILFFYCRTLEEDDYLFNIKSSYVTIIFTSTIKKSKIKKITLHDIRHIYASYLLSRLRNNANAILIVQHQLRAFKSS